jgi:hypothetical protein
LQHLLQQLEDDEVHVETNEELEDVERRLHERLLEIRRQHVMFAESLLVRVTVLLSRRL